MADKLIKNLPSSSIGDGSLVLIGDPSTGALTETSYKALKDYATAGITGSTASSSSILAVVNTYYPQVYKTPTQVSGLYAWYDATNGNSLTVSGSLNSITQWNDLSLSLIHISEPTRPY